MRAAYRAANPDAKQSASQGEKAESEWSPEGLRFRLRLEHRRRLRPARGPRPHHAQGGRPAGALPPLDRGQRLPVAEQDEFTPTPKQMLYGMRAELERITVRRDGERAVEAWAEVVLSESRGGVRTDKGSSSAPSTSRPWSRQALHPRPDPNDCYGSWAAQVVEGLVAGGENALYAVLAGEERPLPPGPRRAPGRRGSWPGSTRSTPRERCTTSSRASGSSSAATAAPRSCWSRGRPGTGKSYSTAFAVFARLQGAMAAGQDFRVFVSCKTHAATDVLLENVVEVQEKLRGFADSQPELFAAYFDPRLLDVPLFRVRRAAPCPPA